MTRRDPPDVAVLAARMQRAYPSLSPFSAAQLADELCAIERAQRRHAERCCSGEDGGYVRLSARLSRKDPVTGRTVTLVEHDPDAEARAGERIGRRLAQWQARLSDLSDLSDLVGGTGDDVSIELQHDPRGRVLLLRLPGEREESTV